MIHYKKLINCVNCICFSHINRLDRRQGKSYSCVKKNIGKTSLIFILEAENIDLAIMFALLEVTG